MQPGGIVRTFGLFDTAMVMGKVELHVHDDEFTTSMPLQALMDDPRDHDCL